METYQSYADDVLVHLLKQDSRPAFAAIYARYFDRLYIHAMGMVRDSALAADVVQDVFTYLWDHRTVEIHTSLSAYLYTSTRHAVLKIIRSSQVAERFRNHVRVFADQSLPMTDDHARLQELQELIESEIRKLPARMRQVFELKYHDDFSNKEIAAELGISEHTVKNQVVNSLRVLRKRLGKMLFFLLIISLLSVFFNVL